jgi:hypothetical protein
MLWYASPIIIHYNGCRAESAAIGKSPVPIAVMHERAALYILFRLGLGFDVEQLDKC